MISKCTTILAAAAFALATPSLAGERTPPRTQTDPGLPGVERFAPATSPTPTTDRPVPNEDGFVRMGDWDVKISGEISWQVGFGPHRPMR